jgi:hypothetical protein
MKLTSFRETAMLGNLGFEKQSQKVTSFFHVA